MDTVTPVDGRIRSARDTEAGLPDAVGAGLRRARKRYEEWLQLPAGLTMLYYAQQLGARPVPESRLAGEQPLATGNTVSETAGDGNEVPARPDARTVDMPAYRGVAQTAALAPMPAHAVPESRASLHDIRGTIELTATAPGADMATCPPVDGLAFASQARQPATGPDEKPTRKSITCDQWGMPAGDPSHRGTSGMASARLPVEGGHQLLPRALMQLIQKSQAACARGETWTYVFRKWAGEHKVSIAARSGQDAGGFALHPGSALAELRLRQHDSGDGRYRVVSRTESHDTLIGQADSIGQATDQGAGA